MFEELRRNVCFYLLIYYGSPEFSETVLTALDLALSVDHFGGYRFFLRRRKEQQQKQRFKNKRLQSLIWNHTRHERSESAQEPRIAL